MAGRDFLPVRSDGARHMPTAEDQRDLLARLQVLEDALVAGGKRNVTVEGRAGFLTWVLRWAGGEPVEDATAFADIRQIEDRIIRQARRSFVMMTQNGTFTWWPRPSAK